MVRERTAGVLRWRGAVRVVMAAACARGALVLACALAAPGVPAQAFAQSFTHRWMGSTITQLDRAPQPAIIDTIVTSALLRVERGAVDSAGVGEVALVFDSLRVTSGGMVRRAADAMMRGRTVLPVQRGRVMPAVPDSATPCLERPLVGLLADLAPSLPDTMTAGQTWSDTLTVASCRAQVPITTTLVAQWRVRVSADTTVWLVDREGTVTLAGQATLREQPVTLEGSGQTSSLYEIRRDTHAVRSWRSSLTVETRISNGQQVRTFSQVTTEAVLAVP